MSTSKQYQTCFFFVRIAFNTVHYHVLYFCSPIELYSKIAAKFQKEAKELDAKKSDLPQYTAMKTTLVSENVTPSILIVKNVSFIQIF
jgi:hypothetical protein